jgi:hypothetical protein
MNETEHPPSASATIDAITSSRIVMVIRRIGFRDDSAATPHRHGRRAIEPIRRVAPICLHVAGAC